MIQLPYIEIDEDMGIDYQDAGPWRSYQLTTYGETLAQLFENACISEIDQDGGTITDRDLFENSDEWEIALKMIETELLEALEKRFLARRDDL